MRRIRIDMTCVIMFFLLSILPQVIPAKTVAEPQQFNLELDAPIPDDPAVITGEVENGLRYYVRANRKPE